MTLAKGFLWEPADRLYHSSLPRFKTHVGILRRPGDFVDRTDERAADSQLTQMVKVARQSG